MSETSKEAAASDNKRQADEREAVDKRLAEDRERADRIRKDGTERLSKGKPTPTQDENDRAKLGEHILEHEDDGSGPDPHALQDKDKQHTRNVEAGRGGSYQTRETQPRPTPPAREPAKSS